MTSSIRAGLTVFRMTGGHTPTMMVELVRTVLAEAAAGRLHPVIGQTFALERAADAHSPSRKGR
jgi:NADPH:quinone reductase-like Zn-dependent oxidoreductase